MAVGLPRLLEGPSAGLTGGRESHCSLCLIMLVLKLPKVDGDLQLVPLMSQAEVLHLKASVNHHELFSEAAWRTHRLLKDLMAYDATSTHELQCAAKSVLRAKGCW